MKTDKQPSPKDASELAKGFEALKKDLAEQAKEVKDYKVPFPFF